MHHATKTDGERGAQSPMAYCLFSTHPGVCPLHTASSGASDFQHIFYLDVKHKVSALRLDAPPAESTSSLFNFSPDF